MKWPLQVDNGFQEQWEFGILQVGSHLFAKPQLPQGTMPEVRADSLEEASASVRHPGDARAATPWDAESRNWYLVGCV